MPYTGVNPDDPNADWTYGSPFAPPPPWLNQNVADLNPAAGPMRRGFTPFSSPTNPLTRSPYEDEQFMPDVAAGGSAGLGTTQQPAADLQTSGPGKAAGQVLSAQADTGATGKMPPPGTTSSAPAPAPTQGSMPPPSMSARSAPPPVSGATPNAPPVTPPVSPTSTPASPSAALNPAIQRDIAALNQPMPQKKGGAMGVVQRLGMALLSATKLASMAQQIVYPEYSAQMAARERAGNELKELGGAQEAMQRGEYYEQQANESKGRYLRVGTGVFDNMTGKWVEQPRDKSNLVAIPVAKAQAVGLDTSQATNGVVWVPPQTANQVIKPQKDPGGMYVSAADGQALGLKPDEDGMYFLPKEGVAAYVTGKSKPPQAPNKAGQTVSFQNTTSKLVQAGLVQPKDITDVNALAKAIYNAPPTVLPEKERADALGYIAANPTPGMQPFVANIRAEGMLERTLQPMIDTKTGQALTMNAEEINRRNKEEPGRFVSSTVAVPAMQRHATFADMQTAVDYAKNSVAALKTIDPQTRAELANALSDESGGRIAQFLSGSFMTTMTPEQRKAVVDLRNLYENALAMRSVQGLGQGSDQMRHAILQTLPNAQSPDVAYMLDQIGRFETTLKNLQTGTPGLGGPAVGGGATQNPNKTGGRGGRPSLDQIFNNRPQ